MNVAKHRNGETGNIKLIWNPATTTFKDPDANSRPEPPPAGYGGRDIGFETSAPPPPDDMASGVESFVEFEEQDLPDDGGQSAQGGVNAVDSGLIDDDN